LLLSTIRGSSRNRVSARAGTVSNARALAKDAAASLADPLELAGWLKSSAINRATALMQDTLHAVTDYFGLSTEV
jgi:hypothetical protein